MLAHLQEFYVMNFMALVMNIIVTILVMALIMMVLKKKVNYPSSRH